MSQKHRTQIIPAESLSVRSTVVITFLHYYMTSVTLGASVSSATYKPVKSFKYTFLLVPDLHENTSHLIPSLCHCCMQFEVNVRLHALHLIHLNATAVK